MTFQGDPYRTLGLAPGASLNEIRSAYRRLAKQYHPDAAGERALPRFLAIQAAYEQLVDGEGRLRSSGPAWGGGERWRAEPGRARASRDAWRARRSGSGGTAGHRPPGSSPGAGGRPGGATGASGGGDPASGPRSTPGSRPPGERQHHARRGPRRATPGSTTYDEAAETPLDPEWDGGAWYGPSSGTYWTINPREYADPRKHGPEYLARARRAAASEPDEPWGPAGPGVDPAAATGVDPAAPPDPAASPRTEGHAEAGDWEWTGTGSTTTDGGAAAWGARAWTYDARDAGPAWTPGREPRARQAGEHRRAAPAGPAVSQAAPPQAEAPPLPDLETLVRRAFPEQLLALLRGPDRRWRWLLALVAWPPIGYSLGGLVSAVTGCATFSASCPEPVPILLLLVQPLIVGVLVAIPPLTAVAAFAALAALAIAIPAGAVLSVGALPRPVIEPTVLGVIVGTTYAIAFVAGAIRLWRRPDPGHPAP